MKKIKVIFPDGSITEVDESDLQSALNAGAKKYTGVSSKQTVKFSDGSTAEVDESDINSAIGAGATVVKKKENTPSSIVPESIVSSGQELASGIASSGANEIKSVKPKTNYSNLEFVPGVGLREKPSYPTVTIPGNEKQISINPDRLPEGFAKTPEGAKQYAENLQSRLTQYFNQDKPGSEENFQKAFDEVRRMDILSTLDNSRSSLNKNDIEGINKFMPFDGVATDEVLNGLKILKNKLSSTVGIMLPIEKKSDPAEQFKNLQNISALSYYIDKLTRAIPQEIENQKTQTVVGADTRSVLRKALTTLPEITVKNENLGDEFFTGLDALKRKDKVRYDNIVKRLNDNKSLASIEVAELTNDGADIINSRNVEKLRDNKITIEQYAETADKTAQIVNDNLYKRPDILQRSIANVIGRYYEKSGGTVIGKWYVSDKEIDAIPESVFSAAGIDISKPESKEAIQKIKDNEGILPFDNAVQKDDLLREAFKGFVQPIVGTAQTIGGLAKSDEEKIIERKLEPLTHYANQRGEYFNRKYGMLADAVNGAGQFVSQYLLMEGAIGTVEGIGAAAGGSEASILVKSPEAIGGTVIRQGTSVGNFLLDKSRWYGQLAVPFLQTYDSYYKTALERTNNPTAAKVMAFTNASVESLSEQMFDNVKFGREVVSNFKGAFNPMRVAKIFDNGVINEVTTKELKATITDVFKQSFEAAKKSIGGTIKEAAEEIAPAFSDYVTTAIANPDAVKNRDVVNEMKDSFIGGLVSFSLPGVVGAASNIRSQFGTSETDNFALAAAAMNRGLVSDALNNLHEDGVISKNEYDHKMQILNTATQSLNNMPGRYADGEKMKPVDANDYLANIVRIKFLKNEADKSDDEAVKETNKEKITALNGLNFDILHKIANEEDRLIAKRDAAKTPEEKAAVQIEIDQFTEREKGKAGGRIYTDFDGTVWDEEKGTLTPLGEELKTKIANGEDVTVLTARKDTPENEQFIADKLGIPQSKIILDLRPKEKAEMLDPGSTFYDNTEANIHWANKRVGVNVINTAQAAATQSTNNVSPEDADLFDRVYSKGEKINNLLDPEQKQQSVDALKDQALSAPASINDKLGGDRKLTIDLIAANGEGKINAKIAEYENELKQEGNSEQRIQDIDNHLSLLDDGLIKSQQFTGQPISAINKKVNIGIGIAPFRSRNVTTPEEDAAIRGTEEYKSYQEDVRKVSEGLGVNVVSNKDTWGGYVDSETGTPVQEVSNTINIEGDLNKARLVAAVLGKAAPEQQDSVLIGEYDENGSGIEHTISTGSVENADREIKLLNSNGIEYFTIDRSNGDIIIVDTNNSHPENIVNFVKQLKENGIEAEHTVQAINAELLFSKDYDRVISEQGGEGGKQNGFDINAFISEAKGKYQQLASRRTDNSKVNEAGGIEQGASAGGTDQSRVNHSTDTQQFFSDTVNGKNQPKKSWSPLIALTSVTQKIYDIWKKFKGAFDTHIETSIPAFRDVQFKKISAITELYKDGGLVVDLMGSEGGFGKTITSINPNIKTINLDINPDMEAAHNKVPVEGASFVRQAFMEDVPMDDGTVAKRYVPTEKADVVHETMGFQFIMPDRQAFVDEVADNYIKPDGVFIVEEKVVVDNADEWINNENKKDGSFKSQYFEAKDIDRKKEEVLLGMKGNQASEQHLLDALTSRFNYVYQYWDSGNFKGYIASNDQAKALSMLKSIGDTTTDYTSRENLVRIENNKKTQPAVKVNNKQAAAKLRSASSKQTTNEAPATPTAQGASETYTAENISSAEQGEGVRSKVIADLKNILPALQKLVPGVKVVLNNTDSEFREATNTKGGRGAWSESTKTMYLNLAAISRASKNNTAYHEGVHPIMNALNSSNPELVKSLAQQIRDSGLPGVEDVVNYADTQAEETRDMETVVEFIASVANGDIAIPKEKGLVKKIVDIINSFLKLFGSSKQLKGSSKISEVVNLANDISDVFAGRKEIEALPITKAVEGVQLQSEIEKETNVPQDIYDESINVIAKELEQNENMAVGEAINKGIEHIESQGVTTLDRAKYINKVLGIIYNVEDSNENYYKGLDEQEKADYDKAIKSGSTAISNSKPSIRERIENIEPVITGDRTKYSAAETFKEAGFSTRGRTPQGETTTISNIVSATLNFIHQFNEETGGNGVRDLVDYLGYNENRRKAVKDMNTTNIRTNKHYSLVNVLYSYIQNTSPTEIGLSPAEITTYSKYLRKLSYSLGRTIGQDLNTAKLRNTTESLLNDMVLDSMFSDGEKNVMNEFDKELTSIVDGEQEFTDEEMLSSEILGTEQELEKQAKQSQQLAKAVRLSEQIQNLKNEPVSEKRSKNIINRIKLAEDKLRELINKIPCD